MTSAQPNRSAAYSKLTAAFHFFAKVRLLPRRQTLFGVGDGGAGAQPDGGDHPIPVLPPIGPGYDPDNPVPDGNGGAGENAEAGGEAAVEAEAADDTGDLFTQEDNI